MKNLTQEEWRTQLVKDRSAVIIDARTKEECSSGIINKAIMIDFLQPDVFVNEIQKLDKSKNFYVYCRSGNRSGKACAMMDEMGFNETYNLLGGMNEWNSEKTNPI